LQSKAKRSTRSLSNAATRLQSRIFELQFTLSGAKHLKMAANSKGSAGRRPINLLTALVDLPNFFFDAYTEIEN
jgi:hypothetical protein